MQVTELREAKEVTDCLLVVGRQCSLVQEQDQGFCLGEEVPLDEALAGTGEASGVVEDDGSSGGVLIC